MRPITVPVLALAIVAAGCVTNVGTDGGGSASTTMSPSASAPTQATAADLAFCIQDTNSYRSLAGKPSLAESNTLESYASTSAQTDAAAGVPHAHFISTNGGGISLAENELLAASLTVFGTVQEAMRESIQAFYAEGPGGGHYQNLEGPFTQLGCGVFIANGLITFAEDFR